jgi:hypothetical protein
MTQSQRLFLILLFLSSFMPGLFRYTCLHESYFAGMNVVHCAYQSDFTLFDHIQ